MTQLERGPRTNSGKSASIEIAGDRNFSQEFKKEENEGKMKNLGEEYKSVQLEAVKQRAFLDKGSEHMMQSNESARLLAIEIGKQTQKEIDRLSARKAELEEEITDIGGNPSDYTVQ